MLRYFSKEWNFLDFAFVTKVKYIKLSKKAAIFQIGVYEADWEKQAYQNISIS